MLHILEGAVSTYCIWSYSEQSNDLSFPVLTKEKTNRDRRSRLRFLKYSFYHLAINSRAGILFTRCLSLFRLLQQNIIDLVASTTETYFSQLWGLGSPATGCWLILFYSILESEGSLPGLLTATFLLLYSHGVSLMCAQRVSKISLSSSYFKTINSIRSLLLLFHLT